MFFAIFRIADPHTSPDYALGELFAEGQKMEWGLRLFLMSALN
jgi:hypothetical protein